MSAIPTFLLPALDQPRADSWSLDSSWRWAHDVRSAGIAGHALARMVARSPHGLAVGPRGALWHAMATSVSPNGMRAETLLGGWTGYSFSDGSSVFSRQGTLLPWIARLPRQMEIGARARMMDGIVRLLPASAPKIARKASEAIHGLGVTAPWFDLEPDVGSALPWMDVRTLVDTLLAPGLAQVKRQPGFGMEPMRVVVEGALCGALASPLTPARVHLVDTDSFFAPKQWSGWLAMVQEVLQTVLAQAGPNGWNPTLLLGQTRTPVTYGSPESLVKGAPVGEVIVDPARALSLSAHARFHATAWMGSFGLTTPETPAGVNLCL